MENIANTSDIKNLIIDVSEKINKKNLSIFVHTSLNTNNIKYSASDIIYANFLEYSKQYQILIFSNKFKYMLFEILNDEDKKLTRRENSSLINFNLYITKSFFVIFKDSIFYSYQTLNYKYKNDELLNFISKKFNITISNSYELSDLDLSEIINNSNKKKIISSFTNLNKKSNKSFILYILYLVLCVFLTLIYSAYDSNVENKKRLQKIISDKEKYLLASKVLKYRPLKNEYTNFINTADKYKLEILSFNYNHEQIEIRLSSKNKNNIYNFLDEYEKFILYNSITKEESTNMFIGTINVKSN